MKDVAGRRNQPITYRFFLNGVQVDRLPDDYAEKAGERLSKVMSEYYRQHPDEFSELKGKDYVEIIPVTSGQA